MAAVRHSFRALHAFFGLQIGAILVALHQSASIRTKAIPQALGVAAGAGCTRLSREHETTQCSVLNIIMFWILKPKNTHKWNGAIIESLNQVSFPTATSTFLWKTHHLPIHVPMWRADCPSATVSYMRVLQRLHWTNCIRAGPVTTDSNYIGITLSDIRIYITCQNISSKPWRPKHFGKIRAPSPCLFSAEHHP